MNKQRRGEELTIMEAVDNLSAMAELDLIADQPLSAEEMESELGEEPSNRQLLNPKYKEENKEVVKQTFRVIHKYLQHVYDTDKEHLKDIETQKGVHAIMLLAGEAAKKLDKYTSVFKETRETEAGEALKEYQELQEFYMQKIMKKFQQVLEKEEAWQAEWGDLESEFLDVQRRGLKDLETVRRDKEYELFYIQKEDGRPFFNRNLLRHIQLVGDFDGAVSELSGEDPFLRIKALQDRIAYGIARQILQSGQLQLEEFFKEAMRYKDKKLASFLIKTTMALMLAANSRNLIQNTIGKNCLSYFMDFNIYLRAVLATEEYRKAMAFPPPKTEHLIHTMLNLINALCGNFFTCKENWKEGSEILHRLAQKGKNEKKQFERKEQGISMWNQLIEMDEQIRKVLKQYPNGPLLKTLDVFREQGEKLGFDPLYLQNFPSQLFSFSFDDCSVDCLRIPSPTQQKFVNKADATPEFQAFLRGVKSVGGHGKHLLFNLQDRTAWKEHARCQVLEELQKKEEFTQGLVVVTLPKSTEFYLQTGDYQQLNEAALFIEQLKEQVASGEQCGFYFPPGLEKEDILKFVNRLLLFIHAHFFDKKETLTRKNRLDFIEIFYLFFAFYFVYHIKPDSLSFTCKDALDTGAAAGASFYAFLKMMSPQEGWQTRERDLLEWQFFSHALIVRERTIDLQRFHRSVSAVATLHAELETEKKSILKECHALFGANLFHSLKIKE